MADADAVALHALHELTKRVHGSLDLRATLDAVAEGVADAAGFEVAAVNLAMPDGVMEIVSVAGVPEVRAALIGRREAVSAMQEVLRRSEPWGRLRFLDHRVGIDDLVDSWVSQGGEPVDEDDEGAWHPEDALTAVLTTPTGAWLGVLSVDVPVDGRKPDAARQQVLELFADHAAIAIMHARIYEELQASRAAFEHAATHDALTGLANRALLTSLAPDLLHASAQVPVGVITLDLDDFKVVNDTCGHHAGDEVLKVVAERMRRCVRAGDVVARTGGDEFVVLMRDPGTAEALPALAARLSAAITDPVVTSAGRHRVGVSVGISLATEPTSLSALLVASDAQMYARKRVHHAERDAPLRHRG